MACRRGDGGVYLPWYENRERMLWTGDHRHRRLREYRLEISRVLRADDSVALALEDRDLALKPP